MIESKGDSNKLDDLLANIKCNINAYDVEGCAYIHWAARLGYTSCIEVLMKYGADITLPTFVNCADWKVTCRRRKLSMISLASMETQRLPSGLGLQWTKWRYCVVKRIYA